MKPAVQEHCERAPGGDSNGGFQHTLVWNVRSREFRASGIGRSKKDAKKEAVKVLLVQLGPVTPHVSCCCDSTFQWCRDRLTKVQCNT